MNLVQRAGYTKIALVGLEGGLRLIFVAAFLCAATPLRECGLETGCGRN